MTNQPKMELIKDEEIHDIFDSIDGINSILCGEKCAQAQLSADEKVHTLALQEKEKIIIELQATLEKQLKQERENIKKKFEQDYFFLHTDDTKARIQRWDEFWREIFKSQYIGGK